VEEDQSKREPNSLETNPDPEAGGRFVGKDHACIEEGADANDGAWDPEDLPRATSAKVDRYPEENLALASDDLRCR